MKELLVITLCLFGSLCTSGCGVVEQSKAANDGQLTPQPTPEIKSSNHNSNERPLCERISEITAFRNKEPTGDPIYEAIIAEGKPLIPCLIEQITDVTPMHDPRGGPVWQYYKVGDTAVFLLVDIEKDDDLLIEMLPAPFREEWKENGVYAYFNYVAESKNRAKLKAWWKSRKKP